ncbi:uncharacterized protein LOC131223080 [Magnolia sinica]|uniref:uncharacterized protein LOC131223080 n=1 Tax=Magnolia sinica TaxID=86752 RepID=UPI00265A48B7|nr:uncharacterized protein LOC131223080 [Magnolia sinica]
MKATEEEGLLNMIRPPRLEDAGLEDCALAPEAIKEAFLKAASSVRTQAKSIFPADDNEIDGGCCVNDPGPSNGELRDVLTQVPPEDPKPCGEAEKGGLPEVSGVKVIVVGVEGGGASDRVLGAAVPEWEERKGGCVEGLLEGLEIGENEDFGDEGSEDEKEDKTILAEAYI